MNIEPMSHATQIYLTSHAQVRSQQRGLREPLITAVYDYADVEIHVGASCRRLSISTRELQNLISSGILTPAEAARCKNVTLIIDGDAVITVYRQ